MVGTVEAAGRVDSSVSSELLSSAFEATTVGMAIVDGNGCIAIVNEPARRMFGYARGEMSGLAIDALVPRRFRVAHTAFRQTFQRTPSTRAMGAGRDLYALRKDGSQFPVEIGLQPIGNPEGRLVLATVVDITERKQREARLQAALHEKELLLGEVHHRVKNNLQIIDSLLNLQARRVADREVHAALTDSQHRIRSLALIHQMLYQSRDFAFVDFNGFLMNLLPRLVESTVVERNRITVDIDAQRVQLPINLAIPCGLIVNELVTNAVKHAFPASRRGTIRVKLARRSDDELEVAVSNDGVPLPSTFTTEQGETLGVQLVNLLAQQMRGSVALERVPMTTFRVRFPYSVPENPQ